MFAVPVKRAEKLALSAPLKKYCASVYKVDPSVYEEDLAKLDALREDVNNAPTVEISLLCAAIGFCTGFD